MKTSILFFALMGALNSCTGTTTKSADLNKSVQQQEIKAILNSTTNDSLMNGIERRVLNAFVNGNINHNDNELVLLEQSLFNLNENKPNTIIEYWYSYACYYHSILFMIMQDNKQSEKLIEKGIDVLSNIKQKTSEHYALLAQMQSFSIQFSPGIQAAFTSKKVKENAENAISLDSLNLRAYYVLGASDFYTPEQYEGGKKVEDYLRKAISLPDQAVKNPYLPSWGKNSAYELLIRFYIRKQQYTEAKQVYSEAIAQFPDDYMINKLASELINH